MTTSDLVFDKRRHRYTVHGVQLTSVTTWVASFFTPFDKKVAKYVARNRRARGEKVTAWDVRKEWKKTGEDGTETHRQIEAWINEGTVPKDLKANRAIEYLHNEMGIRTLGSELQSEQKVYDEKLKLAGTIDLQIIGNNIVSVVDWKTTKKVVQSHHKKGIRSPVDVIDDCNYWHYVLQLNTYAYILNAQGKVISNLSIVHLKDDGYVVYPVPLMLGTIFRMLKEDGRL